MCPSTAYRKIEPVCGPRKSSLTLSRASKDKRNSENEGTENNGRKNLLILEEYVKCHIINSA